MSLDTRLIRQLYRRAEFFEDGEKRPFSGYAPSDFIGHAILDTINELCDEVDKLRVQLDFALGKEQAV